MVRYFIQSCRFIYLIQIKINLRSLIHDDVQLRAPKHDHAKGDTVHSYEEESADVDGHHLVQVA